MSKRKNRPVSDSVPEEIKEEEYWRKNIEKKSKKKKKNRKVIEEQLENNVEDNEMIITKPKIPTNDEQILEKTNVDIVVKLDQDSEDETFNSDDLPSIKKTSNNLWQSSISDDPLHHLIPKLMRLNENDHEMLRKQNITVKNGRFNANENSILLRNWNLYLKEYNIPNKTLLLAHFRYEKSENRKLKKAYQKFARDTNLWLRLAKDLPNRTIYQIYCRARVLLADLKKAKDFNEKDRQIILDLYRKHGDNYTKFCEKHGYNPKCAREVVRNSIKANGQQLNRGEWTFKEMQELKKIVEKLMKELNIESYEGIPWSRVAQKLKRSDMQCRQKFFSKGVFTMITTNQVNNNNDNDGGDDSWKEMKFNIAKFIALLKHLNYPSQDLIDWDFIKEKFSNNFFNLLLRKWRELRVRIPNYDKLTLPEIVDHLYQRKVLKKYGTDIEKMKQIENFINF